MTEENEQLSFTEEQSKADNDPVVCLGMTFNNEDERREYFRNELRRKLPEMKNIEGFPIGEDEDIIALSDPPYYTACPNPWLSEFIDLWEKTKETKEKNYKRVPFVTDVSEGKNDPLYKIPSYFTKVPPKAIIRYIIHYTNPGDIILDAFSGSGMTGLAANLCGDLNYLNSMGYTIDNENNVVQDGEIVSKLGERKAILADLSPAATFTSSIVSQKLKTEVNDVNKLQIAEFINEKIAPLYVTKINDEEVEFDYTVWSYWGECNNCSHSFRLFDYIIDWDKQEMKNVYKCPNCGAIIESDKQQKAFNIEFDPVLQKTINQAKSSLALISYKKGNKTIRIEPKPFDFDKLININYKEVTLIPEELPYMHLSHERNNLIKYWGFSHVNHFYSNRNYYAFDQLVKYCFKNNDRLGLFALISILENNGTKRNRFYVDKRRSKGSPVGPLSNTLYVPNMFVETNVAKKTIQRLDQVVKQKNSWGKGVSIVTNQSATNLAQVPQDSVDFIFTDPPFGGNINYSEQNYLSEWWLKVKTNNKNEVITNKAQYKNVKEYQTLMAGVFKEYYRVLKPNHWIVVEFHNSSNLIWNAIQQSLETAGFIVANVSILDKKHDTMHQGHKSAAVNKDLVIAAYKSNDRLRDRLKENRSDTENVWIFVENHLSNFPVIKIKNNQVEPILERKNFMLFDRMVAFYVQKGLPIPMSAADFYRGLSERYSERFGMYFLQEQALEFDKRKINLDKMGQIEFFINDERSAIEYLKQLLITKPKTYKQIHPDFIKEIQHISKHEFLPELNYLLQQNFLQYEGKGPVPKQIITYLRRTYKDLRGLDPSDKKIIEKAMHRWYVPDPNKQADLEKLREKALLREFYGYLNELEGNKKKLKNFRTEAIRAGFKKAYSEKDFDKIVKVGERLPEKVIQEDDKLLMYYDNACIRLGL
ncbi:DNA methyltransferase [Oceanobacillus aidingensis]|uniref:DNA methyltransferase n=1 Tax=Oceanobacillus aidingensis TaxID=645964 RepID=A0ABV9JSX2_9BACI